MWAVLGGCAQLGSSQPLLKVSKPRPRWLTILSSLTGKGLLAPLLSPDLIFQGQQRDLAVDVL
jgi:hypothetical protein